MTSRLPNLNLRLLRSDTVTSDTRRRGGRFRAAAVLRDDVVVAIRQDDPDCWLHVFHFSQPLRQSSYPLPQASAIAVRSAEKTCGPGHFTLILDSPSREVRCRLHEDLLVDVLGQEPLDEHENMLKAYAPHQPGPRHSKHGHHQALVYRVRRKLYRWEVIVKAGRVVKRLRNEEGVLKSLDRCKQKDRCTERTQIGEARREEPLGYLKRLGRIFRRLLGKHHEGQEFASRDKLYRRVTHVGDRTHRHVGEKTGSCWAWLRKRIGRWWRAGGQTHGLTTKAKNHKLAALGGKRRSFVSPLHICFVPSKKKDIILVDSFTQQIKRINWRRCDETLITWEWPRAPFQNRQFESVCVVSVPNGKSTKHQNYYLVAGDWAKRELVILTLDQGHKVGSVDISMLHRPDVLFFHQNHLCYLNAVSMKLCVFHMSVEGSDTQKRRQDSCCGVQVLGVPTSDPCLSFPLQLQPGNAPESDCESSQPNVDSNSSMTESKSVPKLVLRTRHGTRDSDQALEVDLHCVSTNLDAFQQGSSPVVKNQGGTVSMEGSGGVSEQSDLQQTQLEMSKPALTLRARVTPPDSIEWAPLHLALLQGTREFLRCVCHGVQRLREVLSSCPHDALEVAHPTELLHETSSLDDWTILLGGAFLTARCMVFFAVKAINTLLSVQQNLAENMGGQPEDKGSGNNEYGLKAAHPTERLQETISSDERKTPPNDGFLMARQRADMIQRRENEVITPDIDYESSPSESQAAKKNIASIKLVSDCEMFGGANVTCATEKPPRKIRRRKTCRVENRHINSRGCLVRHHRGRIYEHKFEPV